MKREELPRAGMNRLSFIMVLAIVLGIVLSFFYVFGVR